MRLSTSHPRTRRGLTPANVLVVLLLAAFLVALLLGTVVRLRGTADRARFENHIRKLGAAAHERGAGVGQLPARDPWDAYANPAAGQPPHPLLGPGRAPPPPPGVKGLTPPAPSEPGRTGLPKEGPR